MCEACPCSAIERLCGMNPEDGTRRTSWNPDTPVYKMHPPAQSHSNRFMELTFSQSSPNTTVVSDSQGLPRYRVCSALEWKQTPTTTIYRVTLHGDATPPYDDRDEEWLEELVKIYWHLMGSARIIYNRQMVNISQLVHTEGLFGRTQTFRSPDGSSYQWHLGPLQHPYLELNDGSHPATLVARLHPHNLLSGKRAYLEILPAGIHIVDLIVITFVYMEERRKQKSASS